ncbi:WLM-domain-containing protein [Hypoxylon crocopeplum]|nr:WLM-domain-containing protein [Hypoxylon crocopeplum]
MPSGFERLNVKKSQPNGLIVFIKPLEGPDKATAQNFLERIAAQCFPVMKEHHLSVLSLEEFEPNREFVGRNFNAGEVVQLVLKSLSTGRWLPFSYVQMVMMHELAHCKEMNHSKYFWAVRNKYADEMKSLWSRGYTGEGLWGKGAVLATGDLQNTIESDQDLPEHLCGGTYRSNGRKRKPRKQISYQERKERRILKKFGANGVALGEDEELKSELEKGQKTNGRPRVAGSKRGRELRAAAALARFGQQKKEEKEPQDVYDTQSDTESETASGNDVEVVTDINGKRLVDNKGHNLIKVCEDEDIKDEDAQNERKELSQSTLKWKPEKRDSAASTKDKPLAAQQRNKADPEKESKTNVKKPVPGEASSVPINIEDIKAPSSATGVCPSCTFDNGPRATICGVCSHVLDASKVPDTWKCKSLSCRGSLYLNAGDSGVCGACGERKSKQP